MGSGPRRGERRAYRLLQAPARPSLAPLHARRRRAPAPYTSLHCRRDQSQLVRVRRPAGRAPSLQERRQSYPRWARRAARLESPGQSTRAHLGAAPSPAESLAHAAAHFARAHARPMALAWPEATAVVKLAEQDTKDLAAPARIRRPNRNVRLPSPASLQHSGAGMSRVCMVPARRAGLRLKPSRTKYRRVDKVSAVCQAHNKHLAGARSVHRGKS